MRRSTTLRSLGVKNLALSGSTISTSDLVCRSKSDPGFNLKLYHPLKSPRECGKCSKVKMVSTVLIEGVPILVCDECKEKNSSTVGITSTNTTH